MIARFERGKEWPPSATIERAWSCATATWRATPLTPPHDLRRPTPPPGPYYLLDIDSYWSPDGITPPLEWESIESRYDDAALLAYNLFQQLVTDKYRQEVLLRDH